MQAYKRRCHVVRLLFIDCLLKLADTTLFMQNAGAEVCCRSHHFFSNLNPFAEVVYSEFTVRHVF